LLAVALDESKEVLIFKMAVALGFDAPRAFTLVSMRGAKDTDFGVQVVGRIMRVHRRLQGREVPELLRYGYVFLADAENQTGLTGAAEKINAIRTGLSEICPYTMVVNIAGQHEVQVVQNGQSSFLPVVTPSPGATGQQMQISSYTLPGGQSVLEGLVLSMPEAPSIRGIRPHQGRACRAMCALLSRCRASASRPKDCRSAPTIYWPASGRLSLSATRNWRQGDAKKPAWCAVRKKFLPEKLVILNIRPNSRNQKLHAGRSACCSSRIT
jgi:hypothetical protein